MYLLNYIIIFSFDIKLNINVKFKYQIVYILVNKVSKNYYKQLIQY